jgi:SAM-dependent methyltransferase
VDSTASPLIHDDDFSPAEHRERFAAVCMSSALHHVADLRGFFQFVATILKPGGHFIVSAEPTNTDRFNRTCGHDTRVDLLDVIEGHRTNRTARSASSVMFAEFWAGVGFNREKLGQIAAEYGMEIVGWDVWQWIGMLLNNHARNHLPTGADAERFASLCQKAQEIDAEIKALMPTFATGNYFNMIAAFRKETH